MKKLTAGVLAAAATVLAAGAAQAQIPHITPFSFEARAGAIVPTGDFGDDTNPGLALSGSVTYHAIPLIGIYAGYSYNRPSLDVDGVDGDVTEHGLDVGARLAIPTPLIPIDPYLKAGLVVHQVKLDGTASNDFDSDWSAGYELGAGLGFGFGPVSLTPGISYVHYKAGVDGADDDVTVNYVKADVGVRIRL